MGRGRPIFRYEPTSNVDSGVNDGSISVHAYIQLHDAGNLSKLYVISATTRVLFSLSKPLSVYCRVVSYLLQLTTQPHPKQTIGWPTDQAQPSCYET